MQKSDQRGFTLVEIMLALVILGTAGAIALSALGNANRSLYEAKVRQRATEKARKIMNQITDDIRDAGFGVVLNDLGNASALPYFVNGAFDDIHNPSGSDGVILRGVKLGSEVTSEMPATSREIKVKDAKAFLPYEGGYALVYVNGEFQILHITKSQVDAKHVQHKDENRKWDLPPGTPLYRLDEIRWTADSSENVYRTVNISETSAGTQTHKFSQVQSIKFRYVLQNGQIVDELNGSSALMCIEVHLDVYEIGRKKVGGSDNKYHVILTQRVAPRNL